MLEELLLMQLEVIDLCIDFTRHCFIDVLYRMDEHFLSVELEIVDLNLGALAMLKPA